MARDCNDGDSKVSPIGRRTYLGLTAAAAVGAVGAGHAGAATDYETITVGSGEHFTHTVTDGEVFENKLIDITADGAGCELGIRVGSGTGVIRNVGVKGVNESSGANGITPAAENADGKAVIENVYLGDGGSDASRHPGIWVDGDDHRGLCVIRHTNVQWFTDNGIYASGPAAQMGPSEGGDTHIESSFARNNNISNFRIGTDDSYIKDSVVVVDDTPPDAGTGTNGRGLWMRGHSDSTLAANCDVAQDMDYVAVDTRYEDDQPTLRDSRVKGSIDDQVITENVTDNPSREPPSGCPTTAKEAASGSSDGSDGGGGGEDPTGGSDLPHGITISGGSSSSPVDYSFRVTKQLEKTEAYGASIDDEDVLRFDGIASGEVTGGADSYAFSGDVTGFSLDGSASVSLDGESVSPGSLGSSDLALPHTLCISGGSPSNAAMYDFTVSDSIRKTTGCNATMDDDDTISSDGSVSGGVAGGADSFRFAGDVTSFSLDGDATVLLDGQEVDPSTLGSDGSTTHVLTITGDQSSDAVHYEFSVDGDLSKSTANGATIDDDDTVSGGTATGSVLGGSDSYEFTGSITDFGIDGPATLTLDGESVSAAELDPDGDGTLSDSTDLPKYLVIDGSGSTESANYSFAVTGDVVKDPSRGSIQESDVIDGTNVTGTVVDGVDAYLYSGAVKNFQTDGPVAVEFGKTS